MRDIANDLSVAQSLAPSSYTASTNGTAVDLANFDGAAAVIDVGAYTDGTHTFEVQHAPDDGSGNPGTWEAVPDTDLDGTEPVVDAAGDANTIHEIGYQGANRHLRVVVTTSGTTSGAEYAASVVRGHARKRAA